MASDHRQILLAEDAAQRLFNARNGDTAPLYEPTSLPAAEAAVRRLGKLFNDLPGAIAEALDAARDSGDLLSSDKLQGISEIIQNADDVDASQIRLILGPTDLWVGHDGSPVQLPHVLGLATPWLSTKGSEADTTGRFGIGLMTLRSLSRTLEIHCHPYHVQLGEPTLSPVDPPTLPQGLDQAGWTILRIPLERETVSREELEQWLDRWDDAALLFLRSISKVTLLDGESSPIRELAIRRHDYGKTQFSRSNPNGEVSCQRVDAADDRSWIVYSQNSRTPAGVSRTRKATEETTPVAVAFPLHPVELGQIYAGLPVTHTHLPLFANAQFDPLASRRDFPDNNWNQSLVSLVAELWSQAALDFFSRDPKAAWQAMPRVGNTVEPNPSLFTGRLEAAIVAAARRSVASELSFPVPRQGNLQLSELAVEEQPLENILTVFETAKLAGLTATLPFPVRDQDGRWRLVLDDWRLSSTAIPETVTVERALELLKDVTRSVHDTIALTAAGLQEGLSTQLLDLPCVVTKDSCHIVPPQGDGPEAVAATSSTLAEQLGVVTLLHPAHLGDGEDAHTIIKWLRQLGTLLDNPDDRMVIRRLAAAGMAGRQIKTPLTDEQVQYLRAAFELIDPSERQDLGPQVGAAIWLQAFKYEIKGRQIKRKSIYVRPVDAYLPRAVDREPDNFATAAGQSPGIAWLSDHYARILRSPAGRAGIGAQRFLRLLGAQLAPRLRLHPGLERRYTGQRLGLHGNAQGSPLDRSLVLKTRDATYTLQDRDCPDLMAIVLDISRLRREKRTRRKRAAALLATLARAWDRLYSDFAEVDAASHHYGWIDKGRIDAFWLWEARDVPWLDDESGTPRRPCDLRIRTAGNVAIYGEDSPDYLHPDFLQPSLSTVLAALSVSGDPDRSQLVTRLKELREEAENDSQWTAEDLKRETAVIYKALARSLMASNSRSGPGLQQLRRDFQYRSGLILTDLGWLPPQAVLAGPPIFGIYKAFAPAVADTSSLWVALRLRQPTLEDCVDVIRVVARKRGIPGPEEEAILIQTMRVLASQAGASVNRQVRAKLRRLPLWTSRGWMRKRPVYTADDQVLVAGLRTQLPFWEPGGELQQFRSILDPLHVKEIDATAAEVTEPDLAEEHEESSNLFKLSMQQLQEDLSRNDPQLAKSIWMSWDLLGEFRVFVHPSLALGVTIEHDGKRVAYRCNVTAKVDKDRNRVFVKSPEELSRVDTGGRALATLFRGDPRHLAQAWRAACDRAESGRQARLIELAEQRAKRQQDETESEIVKRTVGFQEHTAARHRELARRRVGDGAGLRSKSTVNGQHDDDVVLKLSAHRVLVDPQALNLVNPLGHIERMEATPRPQRVGRERLAEPKPGVDGPRGGAPIRLYSEKDKETVGLEILRKVLSSDEDDISDLRSQRGVGADAIDELQHFYELKVSAGTEPDQVTLTNAEVQRALTTPDFFLVVVSSIEGVDARPKVRVIVDPLSQLHPTDRGVITLSGVRNATSLTYEFEQMDSPVSVDGAEDLDGTAN